MPNIAALYADLRTSIGRGTANDAVLPTWCQETLNEIETDTTLQWMRKTGTFSLAPAADGNRFALPSMRVKAVDWVRPGTPQGANGAIVYGDPLVGVNPYDFSSVDEGVDPTGFYVEGVSFLVTDAIPSTATSVYMAYYEFSEWPEDTSQTPAVLARHYAGFKALAMMTAARNLRDQRLAEVWTGTAEKARQAIWLADGELQFKHRRGMAQRER